MSKSKPNILVVMSDQHSACFSSVYGHPSIRTPHMERLAADGTCFTNAYCPCPLCVPSRWSFMTGQRVQDVPIWDNAVIPPASTRTWPMALREAGYDVVLSGKMHLRGDDQLRGFREQLSSDPAAQNARSAPVPNWSAGGLVAGHGVRTLPCGAGPGSDALDDASTDAGIAYIQAQATESRPWAMVVGILAPHRPWRTDQAWLDQYPLEDIELPHTPPGHLEKQAPWAQRRRDLHDYPDEGFDDDTIRRNRQAYYALCSRVDNQLGRILDALDQSGQADDTLVIYTSDHGEMLGEHGMWMKSSMYEQAIRIPMIARWPHHVPAGRHEPALVTLCDISATICNLADTALPNAYGSDLLHLLTAEQSSWREDLLCEHYATWVDRPLAALRHKQWKLIQSHGEPAELYDLDNDPGEFQNLACHKSHGDVLADMTDRLMSQWDSSRLNQSILASQKSRMPHVS